MKKIVLKTLGIILIGVFLLQVPVTMAADTMNELKIFNNPDFGEVKKSTSRK